MKGRTTLLLVVGLVSIAGLLSLHISPSLTGGIDDGGSVSRSQAPANPQETAATMFLLLFTTSLVGLYVAARHVRRSGSGFMMNALSGDTAKAEKAPELEAGTVYLVTQGQNKALKTFVQELKKGRPGLCITRTYPEKLIQSWDLKGAKVFWLSNEQENGRGAIVSLDSLSSRITEFLTGQEPGVVLLDGVEYLFVQNSFTEVMRLLQDLKDALPHSGSKLIIPIDLLALVERQRALLTREFLQI